jgi:hypothetical protein
MESDLSLSRQFSAELQERAIESCTDLEDLRRLAKTLLKAWQLQTSFSEAYAAQLMGLQRRSSGPA